MSNYVVFCMINDDDFLGSFGINPDKEPRKEKGVSLGVSSIVKTRVHSIPDQSMHSDIVCSNMVSLIWTGSNVPDEYICPNGSRDIGFTREQCENSPPIRQRDIHFTKLLKISIYYSLS